MMILLKNKLETLEQNCKEFGIRLADLDSPEQGIVHVIGPEFGLTQPGMTIVCGDSHTSTHGAFGSIAFGIGTSEVEHVLATQTLWQTKPKTLKLEVNGKLGHGVNGERCHSYMSFLNLVLILEQDILLSIVGKYSAICQWKKV